MRFKKFPDRLLADVQEPLINVCFSNRPFGVKRFQTTHHDSVDRRLAAILAADVVGYSQLMSIDEVRTLNALKGHRRELLGPQPLTDDAGALLAISRPVLREAIPSHIIGFDTEGFLYDLGGAIAIVGADGLFE